MPELHTITTPILPCKFVQIDLLKFSGSDFKIIQFLNNVIIIEKKSSPPSVLVAFADFGYPV